MKRSNKINIPNHTFKSVYKVSYIRYIHRDNYKITLFKHGKVITYQKTAVGRSVRL